MRSLTSASWWSQSSRISIAVSSRNAAGNRSRPSLRTALAIAPASIWSDFPRSRSPRREASISFGATRTTRSPAAMSAYSRCWETCRQSSIAHTISWQSSRAQRSASRWPYSLAGTSRSLSSCPRGSIDGRERVRALVGIRSITIIQNVLSIDWFSLDGTSGGQAFPGGDCHAPIRSRRRSRAAVDDTTDDGQAGGHRPTNRPRVSPSPARDPTRPAGRHQRQSLPARKHPATRPSHQAPPPGLKNTGRKEKEVQTRCTTLRALCDWCASATAKPTPELPGRACRPGSARPRAARPSSGSTEESLYGRSCHTRRHTSSHDAERDGANPIPLERSRPSRLSTLVVVNWRT